MTAVARPNLHTLTAALLPAADRLQFVPIASRQKRGFPTGSVGLFRFPLSLFPNFPRLFL